MQTFTSFQLHWWHHIELRCKCSGGTGYGRWGFWYVWFGWIHWNHERVSPWVWQSWQVMLYYIWNVLIHVLSLYTTCNFFVSVQQKIMGYMSEAMKIEIVIGIRIVIFVHCWYIVNRLLIFLYFQGTHSSLALSVSKEITEEWMWLVVKSLIVIELLDNNVICKLHPADD